MGYPEQFGQPCWERDQAEKCINIVAQVGSEKASLFLATHTPINNINDVKSDALVSEEEAFQHLFSLKGEVRGVVRGASGAGKSHLIRWINLRAEYAVKKKEMKLDQFKMVMVHRDTGSIKAALKQIVEQLGGEFSSYIESIKSSVDKFSDETIREELITEIALVINKKWERLNHKPIPKDIKILGDVLLSPGYRKWLGREGGVIAKKIARWTESSTPEERESAIHFSPSELKPDPGFLTPQLDAPDVLFFVQQYLEYDDIIADDAVNVLNLALIDAQQELTGIKGSKLSEIFTDIRRKLHKQGKQLAIFIEDATAASGGLDRDLFRAFEQNSNKDLCRMIALLGMTNEGWESLPRNEQDRVDFQYDIGENASLWATDVTEVANFAARYLNAIRCNNNEIDELADKRARAFDSDIPKSKCDKCPHLKTCHETFGFVGLKNEVKVGLFPFSNTAPQKLLKSLTEIRHRTSPRGLLDLIMNKVLTQSYDQFAQHIFPNDRSFAVKRVALTYWTEVENKYLRGGAWLSGTDKNRAKFLAEFWFNAETAHECVSFLKPYLSPLSLPGISEELTGPVSKAELGTTTKTEKKAELGTATNIGAKTETVTTKEDDRELKDLLTKLEDWRRGEQLKSDSKFRRYILDFITKAMKWQDHRGVPVKIAKDNFSDIKPIRIKGQISRPSGQKYFFDFDRNEETHHLLEALVRYKHEGKESWCFGNGELHKRRVYRWFRRNQRQILTSLEPSIPSLAQDAVKCAAQLLALAIIIKTRSTLPKKEPQSLVSILFSEPWDDENRPVALTRLLGEFFVDIENKWHGVKQFLVSELGVGQGEAPPSDFIDPLPILDVLKNYEKEINIKALPPEIDESFWGPRFFTVYKLSAYGELHKALKEENKAIKDHLETLKGFLLEYGFDGIELKNELVECIKVIVELVEVKNKNLPLPDPEFDNLWRSNHLQNNRNSWGASVAQASKIIAAPKNIDTLCYDPALLKEVCYDLSIVTNTHLEKIENLLSELENPVGEVQGGTVDEMLNELKQICKIVDKECKIC
jgi:hypothetical protein